MAAKFPKKKAFSPEDLSPEEEEKACIRYALYLLSRQGYSNYSLQTKLKSKGYSIKASEEAVSRCVSWGYLCDESWAKSFVRVQLSKKYGLGVIRQKLKAKGIHSDLADKILSDLSSGEAESISQLLEGKYRNKDLKDVKERNKVVQSLLRRGFSYEKILEGIQSRLVSAQ